MARTRASRCLALLLGFCTTLGITPGAFTEPLDDPILLGSIGTGYALAVVVVGTLVYVADGVAGLRVIDSIPEPGVLLPGHPSRPFGPSWEVERKNAPPVR